MLFPGFRNPALNIIIWQTGRCMLKQIFLPDGGNLQPAGFTALPESIAKEVAFGRMDQRM